jgi:hypothetical protein
MTRIGLFQQAQRQEPIVHILLHTSFLSSTFVMVSIHIRHGKRSRTTTFWIPAFAGMTPPKVAGRCPHLPLCEQLHCVDGWHPQTRLGVQQPTSSHPQTSLGMPPSLPALRSNPPKQLQQPVEVLVTVVFNLYPPLLPAGMDGDGRPQQLFQEVLRVR